jgi:uncharacterized protein YbjT (DUF2867 family)
MAKTEKLLIIGNGKTGRRVAARLRTQDLDVTVASRSAATRFDWELPETWEAALQGISGVYITYYPDIAIPGAAEAIGELSKLAVKCGVRRLVLLSGRGEPSAQRAENLVQDSGAEWTVIRSSFFNQNFSESFLAEAVTHGEIAFPAGNVKEPFIDAEDIADVAAAALTGSRHAGQLYEVTGPQLMTFDDISRELSAGLSRPIRYIAVSPADYEAGMLEQGVPLDFARMLTDLFGQVLDGRNAYLGDGVQRALNREPNSFDAFVRTAVAQGAWDSRSVTHAGH